MALTLQDGGPPLPLALRRPGRAAWTSLLLSVLALAATAALVDAQRVLAELRQVQLAWLVPATLLAFVQFGLLGARWALLARKRGLPLPVSVAVAEYALSVVLNQVLPTGVAGDGVRALRHKRRAPGVGMGAVLEVLALDRASGQVALSLLALASIPLTLELGLVDLGQLAKGLGAALVVGVFANLALRWWPPARRLRPGLLRFFGILFGPRQAVGHLGLSALFVCATLAQLYFAARAVGVVLAPRELFWFGPLLLLAASLPSFFGGWGVREGASAALFAALGMPASMGMSVSVVFGAFALLSSLPGLLLVPLVHAPRAPASSLERWERLHAALVVFAVMATVASGANYVLAAVAAGSFSILGLRCWRIWTPSGRFGLPNVLTAVRLLLTVVLLLEGVLWARWLCGAIALLVLSLDALDGWVARRSGDSSAFGALFDVEADALLVLGLSVLLWEADVAGPWVLVAGLWRYAFVLLVALHPGRARETTRSRLGRVAYVVMVACFVAALSLPALGPFAYWLCALGTGLLSVSFGRSLLERYGWRSPVVGEHPR